LKNTDHTFKRWGFLRVLLSNSFDKVFLKDLF